MDGEALQVGEALVQLTKNPWIEPCDRDADTMPLDLHQLMKRLSARRRVFHSEADFQHELAWQIRMQYPDLKIRLEYPAFGTGRQNDALDIWVEDKAGLISAIELKYITQN